jgi:hypothetical protein
MSADVVFTIDVLSPNESFDLFIHGYADREAVNFCIVPRLHSNEPPGAVQVKAQMTEGVTVRHVDGTVGHNVIVVNQSVGPQPYIQVDVIESGQFF